MIDQDRRGCSGVMKRLRPFLSEYGGVILLSVVGFGGILILGLMDLGIL